MKKRLRFVCALMLIVAIGALATGCGSDKDTPPADPTYTLSYDLDGGTGNVTGGKFAGGGTVTLPTASAVTKTNYTLIGWNDGTVTRDPGALFTMPAKDVTLKAVWQENGQTGETEYALSYDLDGGTGTATGGEYVAGATVELPSASDVTKANHTLTGWNDGTTTHAPGATFTMPAKAVTLTAVWQENEQPPVSTYTITYKPGENGTGTDITEAKNVGETIKLKTIAEAGFTTTLLNAEFLGWKVENGQDEYLGGADYTGTADVVFVAQWGIPGQMSFTEKSGKATLNIIVYDDPDEGKYAMGTLDMTDGSQVEVLAYFDGTAITFYNMSNDYEELATGTFVNNQLNIAILYQGSYYVFGNATVAEYTVTFDPANGEQVIRITSQKDLLITVPNAPTSSDGKIFRDWRTSTGMAATAGAKLKVTADRDYVANYAWKATFKSGGASGTMNDIFVNDWSGYSLPGATGFTYENKKFVGWTTDGGTTVLKAGEKYTGTPANVEFTAVWEDVGEEQILTFVGDLKYNNLSIVSITVNVTQDNVEIKYKNMFNKEKTEIYTEVFDGIKYCIGLNGDKLWAIISEDGQTISLYDYQTCDTDDLIGSLNLAA